MLPTPATPDWSSRNDFNGTIRFAAISPSASGVKASEKGSTPSLMKRSSSFASSIRKASPKRRGSVNQTSRPSSSVKRARRCRSDVERSASYSRRPSEGSSLLSPSTRTKLPVIRRCMTSVRAPSSASSRYFPRRPNPSIVAPSTAASSLAGDMGRHQRASRTSSPSIRCPVSSGSSWRQTVSTSGNSGTRQFYPIAVVFLSVIRKEVRPHGPGWHLLLAGGGARVGLEVRLLQALAREVGVELGGGDVGVAEHLLDGAQVAATREQVGGEAVAQGVWAHLACQAGIAGVALDDFVEALATQRAAAEVDEELRLVAVADQLRPAAAEVTGDRRDRLAAERHQPFLAALAAGAQEALVQIDVG